MNLPVGFPEIGKYCSFEAYDTDYEDDAQVSYFRLNGSTFKVSEDPNDGYRSSIDSIIYIPRNQHKFNNVFQPPYIVRPEIDGTETHYFIKLVDQNEDDILVMGTDNTDDYYPCYVCSFSPKEYNDLDKEYTVKLTEFELLTIIKALVNVRDSTDLMLKLCECSK